MSGLASWVSLPAVVATLIIYNVTVAFYRYFLHPLSKFPGPKLAAISPYYEAYYDVWQGGRYTWKIAELHKQYGPIVRISPYELHVSDPTFFNTLYRQDAAYDKYGWTYKAFGVDGGTVTTVSHNFHRARRQPLAPYFSQAKVENQQDLIRRHVDKLHNRLVQCAEAKVVFNLGAAMTALTRDVANDYILNKSYNSLDKEDFDVAQLRFSQGAGSIWRLTKFVRFVTPMMQSMPPGLAMKIGDEDTKQFFRFLNDVQQDTKRLIGEALDSSPSEQKRRNVVDEIMNSKLPASEKTFLRVFDEVGTTTGAGFETSAAVLRMVLFHVFSNETMLQHLRAELATTSAGADWKTLRQLPYLTATIHEGLRLSPGIASRMARISPDVDIHYKDWCIPAGTPVGMSTILLHADESLWPEPKSFKPERWLVDGQVRRVEIGFAPFSRGTRVCLGQHLAWAEMYMVLADLIVNFDFQIQDVCAEDFEGVSDNFSIGTRGKGNLPATAVIRH